MHNQYQQSYKVPAPMQDTFSNPSADSAFGSSGSNSMSLPSSSCSGASSPRAGRSDSFEGELSTKTRRQRSRSSHVRPSKDEVVAKAAKTAMMSSIQMHLISAVNNKEVTKREKKLAHNELNQIHQSGVHISVLQNKKGADDSDVAARRDGFKKSVASNDLLNLINERPSTNEDKVKTRANKIPSSSKLVFSNLNQQQQNCNASTPSSTSNLSIAAESQNKLTEQKKSSIEQPKNSIEIQRTSRNTRPNTTGSSLTPRGFSNQGNSRMQKLSLQVSQNGPELTQTSLTPSHSSGSNAMFQQVDSTNDTSSSSEQNGSNGIRPAPIIQAPERERQIKYLGLVIEKDEEWDIESDDEEMFRKFKSLRAELVAFENGTMSTDQQPYIQRQYFPIRDRYIKIVKSCRRRSIESFEKRGGKDFKRTLRSLYSVAEDQHVRYQQEVSRTDGFVNGHRRQSYANGN